MTLLNVENLAVHGATGTMVAPISARLEPGQAVTLIGETGSGKSLFAQTILGTLPRGLRGSGALHVAGSAVP